MIASSNRRYVNARCPSARRRSISRWIAASTSRCRSRDRGVRRIERARLLQQPPGLPQASPRMCASAMIVQGAGVRTLRRLPGFRRVRRRPAHLRLRRGRAGAPRHLGLAWRRGLSGPPAPSPRRPAAVEARGPASGAPRRQRRSR